MRKVRRTDGMKTLVAERLKQLRQDFDLNQVEISEKTKIPQCSWSRYESGEMLPSLEALLKISDFSGYSIDWILGRTHTRSDMYCSAYDLLHVLSSIFMYSDARGYINGEGEMVLTAQGDMHEKLIQSIWEQAMEFPQKYDGYAPHSVEELETEHREWLKEKRWQYAREDLTHERDNLMWTETKAWKPTLEQYLENPMINFEQGIIPKDMWLKMQEEKKKKEQGVKKKKGGKSN